MTTETITAADISPAERTLRIELLALDLSTCTRCLAADRSLRSALDMAGEVLEASGRLVEVERIRVESAEQAFALRLVSSPTIRVAGHDVALELRESPCGSEACTDGCGDQVACRVWVHHGREYTEPPVAMIVEAILRHADAGAPPRAPAGEAPYELPQNLARFFSGRAAPAGGACCSPSERESCCEPAAKEACCAGAATGGACGCR